MKIASTIARYLLGLMFTVFGLNGFLSFIPQPPPVNRLAIQFFVAISASHFATSFFAVQVVGVGGERTNAEVRTECPARNRHRHK